MIHVLAIKPDEPGFELGVWLCLGVGLLLSVGLIWLIHVLETQYKLKRDANRRGFEVKSNAGEEPVIREKENDHG